MPDTPSPLDVLIVAVPETAGSALYGMVDVLSAAGNLWQLLVGTEAELTLLRPRIVSPGRNTFQCGNQIPVTPDLHVGDDPQAPVIVLPEIWLSPTDTIKDRYPELMDWIRRRYEAGSSIYSACSGSIMLAETGLLDGRDATSHWGYDDLFRRHYPKVRFRPEPNLCFADATGRIVTAGGTSSWHDLAIHIIARHCSVGEATRIAKVYLLKWHDEGQLPYASLVRRVAHADSVVRRCEAWLADGYRMHDAIRQVVEVSRLPERTLKRRFKSATGQTLIDRIQNLRIEEAKRLLERGSEAVESVSAAVGYENLSFFRRLFKRRTGLSPAQYRRMFQSYQAAAEVPAKA